jgi:DNA invertase Pin-like site-specific DNA recombinase
MQQLLADIDAGKIDIIVVYKVDRLTRSLMDFAKIVERLDARGVSFVSVTQAFNTTTSMGRLTLNVLLSFAQFEREVTGERIRDKIAASKAKGMWMGGNVPLGYDLHERRLVVNAAEADQVRHIFSRFTELKSGVKLMHELRSGGIVSKRWTSRSDRAHGGVPFSCGALYHLLQNRLYLGEIVHRGTRHRGEHEAIISTELFDAVQDTLAANRKTRGEIPKRSDQCWLAGLVRDGEGNELRTSFSYGRAGRLYRYYVSGSLDPARPQASRRPKRVPAAPLERLVLRTLSKLFGRQVTIDDALALIAGVELHERSIQVAVDSRELLEPHEPAATAIERLKSRVDPHRLRTERHRILVIVDRQPVFRGGTASGALVFGAQHENGIAVLRSAHRLLQEHSMTPAEPERHQQARAPSWQRQRRVIALGLLSPGIQKAILQGKAGIRVDRFMTEPVPLAWADQKSIVA